MENVKSEIREITKLINNAWTSGNTDALVNLFHKNMVIVQPNLMRRTEGREKCIDSYAEFNKRSELIAFKQNDVMVDVFEDTVIAAYIYNIRYKMEDEFFEESGKDVFVFRKYDEKWLAVWRTIIPSIESR